jgi:ribonuclease T1
MNLNWINIFRVTRTLPLFALAVCLALQSSPATADSGISKKYQYNQYVAISDLPPEAGETLRLIRQGGPFPYARDGSVFGNYEKRLPRQQRGYYHEYTVKTPGVRNRGARRIVCGPPVECYYTNDHYETFRQIRE